MAGNENQSVAIITLKMFPRFADKASFRNFKLESVRDVLFMEGSLVLVEGEASDEWEHCLPVCMSNPSDSDSTNNWGEPLSLFSCNNDIGTFLCSI